MDVPAAIRLCASVWVRADGLTTYAASLKHQLDFALVPLDILHTRRRIFYLSVAVDEDRHRFFCMYIYIYIYFWYIYIFIHIYVYLSKSLSCFISLFAALPCGRLQLRSSCWVVKLLLSPSCHKLLLSETASNGEGASWWQECLMQPLAGNMSTCMCKERWQKKNIGTLIPAWVALLVEQICS